MSNVFTFKSAGGFTRMDNQLMDALAAVHLSPAEFKTIHAIARLVIGYNLTERRITADEVAKMTNILPAHVSRAISSLLARRVLYRVGGSRGEIGICSPSEWVYQEPKKEQSTQPKSVETTKSGNSDNVTKLPISDDSLLYTKEKPLVTVPTEQITAPQGAEPAPSEAKLVVFTGEDFEVDATLITKWAEAYAPIDVEAEIKRAAAWASGSKPKKDWRRFLVNWLGRAFKRSPNGASEAGVPVDKIIDLYHKVCPNLPAVTVKSDKVLRSMIAERWNESPDHQSGQGFWLGFFQKANNRNQVFFRGQNVQPRLEALVSRAVFREISEAAQ
ncbi:phage replication protein [Pseudomonas plecoglossicida]|uniref:replication protein n=1 Tax=Pseudomonas plecoglossicida TaxID=70775 RepID=UPI000C7B1A44|nr:replication protein [Pseudomonas plecoglossicida]PLU99897.1 phage replication protein [Pseudomonas plecoglossicida]PLV09157.1 phage replication protein [Pseudomonas plecoglossicida]